jgi:AcrR family transcriptional regulator
MSKGERTRAAILDEAAALTSTEGLSGVTIGVLADRLGMSKSGLFAHFGSKEQLQQAVLEHAAELFIATVINPTLQQPRGLPRLRALFDNWISWGANGPLPGGCPIHAASFEFDDRPGPIRDYLAATQARLHAFVAEALRKTVAMGELRADLDCEQGAFELIALAQAFALNHRLMRTPQAEAWTRAAFDRFLTSNAAHPH